MQLELSNFQPLAANEASNRKRQTSVVRSSFRRL